MQSLGEAQGAPTGWRAARATGCAHTDAIPAGRSTQVHRSEYVSSGTTSTGQSADEQHGGAQRNVTP